MIKKKKPKKLVLKMLNSNNNKEGMLIYVPNCFDLI